MRTINGFPFTEQQNLVVDTSVLQRKSAIVAAAAGSSKSTTSLQVAREFRGVTQYTVFGNRNAKEWLQASKGCAKVASNYGLAHRAVGYKYRQQGRLAETDKHIITAIIEKLGKKNLKSQEVGGYNIDTNTQAYDILRMITKYCYSIDEEMTIDHGVSSFIYPDESLDIKDRLDKAYYCYLLPRAKWVWGEMWNMKSDMPVSHDFYMKRFALSRPKLHCDLLISDETQDINPVFAQIIRNQYCQKLVLGDGKQAIYGWRNSIDAMNSFDISTKLQLSKSFRFGEKIGHLAYDIINFQLGESIQIEGFENIDTKVHTTPAHFLTKTILCRTNSECVRHLVENYGSYNVKVVGDMAGMIRNIKGVLALRAKSKNPAKKVYGPLSIFKNYKDLVDYSQTPAGGEIKTLIGVMQKASKMGIDAIKLCDILAKSAKTRKSDITVSTAHKAKGMEFDNVQLGSDFRRPCDEDWTNEDANLLYVAATRAMKNLDISQCAAILECVGLPFEHLLEKKK